MDLQIVQGTIAVAVVILGVLVFWLLKGWVASQDNRRGGRPTWVDDAPRARRRQKAPTVTDPSPSAGTATETPIESKPPEGRAP